MFNMLLSVISIKYQAKNLVKMSVLCKDGKCKHRILKLNLYIHKVFFPNKKTLHLTWQTLLQHLVRSTSALGSTSDIVWTEGKGQERTQSQQPGWSTWSPSSCLRGKKFSGQSGDPSLFPLSEKQKTVEAIVEAAARIDPCRVNSHEYAFGCAAEITNNAYSIKVQHMWWHRNCHTLCVINIRQRRVEAGRWMKARPRQQAQNNNFTVCWTRAEQWTESRGTLSMQSPAAGA